MITLFGKTKECIVRKTVTQDLIFFFSHGFEYIFFFSEMILFLFNLLKGVQEHSRKKKRLKGVITVFCFDLKGFF